MISDQKKAHFDLLAATQQVLHATSNDVATSSYSLGKSYPFRNLKPYRLHVQTEVGKCLSCCSTQTQPLVQAVIDASPFIKWQQSYTQEDGFDAHYLRHYGWFNLISPDGPLIDTDLRISIGYWGEGFDYKEHWHEPEETYLVLAGAAVFHSEGRAPRHCGAGDVIHHNSHQHHRIEMLPGPLLAMAIWQGNSLTDKPSL